MEDVMVKTFDELVRFCHERNVEGVDLKFVDLFGRWHHLSLPFKRLDEELFSQGEPFDGSSTPGFKSVEGGDMVLIPDISTAEMDPFWDRPTVSLICSVYEADTREHFKRDPRGVAKRAEKFLIENTPAGKSMWGPEYEFYIFDSVNVREDVNESSYRIDSDEADWNSGSDGKNLGHKIPRQGGYHAIPPLDCMANLRAEMAYMMQEAAIPVRYHHHEVGGPGQSEIEVMLGGLLEMGDNSMRTKYIIKNVARKYGKTATFMPKPLFGEAGSGMHFHQYLIGKNGENLFWGPEDEVCGLSQLARYYIGGLLYHGRALLGLTNPSTNSYKRLIPGFEAPTKLFYGLANRCAAIRVPKYANTEETKRIEFRSPDGTCNIYFAMAAQLMAGIDGIRKKIDPAELGMGPFNMDIKKMPAEVVSRIQNVPATLVEALDALQKDKDFLLEGGVFTEDTIDAWVQWKLEKDHYAVRNRPHPYEIKLYFDM